MRITSSHGRRPRRVRILSVIVTLATIACVLFSWALAVRFELVPRAYVPGVTDLIGGFETFLFPIRNGTHSHTSRSRTVVDSGWRMASRPCASRLLW